MLSTGVYVAAVDMVSPLGTDLETQLEQARRGQSGIGRLTRFRPAAAFPCISQARFRNLIPVRIRFFTPRKLAHWTSPVFRHALLVCHRALADCGIEITPELAPRPPAPTAPPRLAIRRSAGRGERRAAGRESSSPPPRVPP